MADVLDIDPRSLIDFSRNEAQEVNRNTFTLSRFLPAQLLDDLEYRVNQGKLNDVDAATVRTFDVESPIAGRRGVTTIKGALPPISRKIPLTEEQFLRKRALDTGNNGALVEQVYDDVAAMTRSVQARLEMFRGEALYTGKLTINENRVQAVVDYGRAGGHTVAPGTLWSNLSASTPLTNLLAWKKVYNDTNGVDPGRILTSSDVVLNLLRNAEVLAATFPPGTPTLPSSIPLQRLGEVLNIYGLPQIETYDVKVRVNGTQTRVIPADRVIFLPPDGEPLGNTFYGVTRESIDAVAREQIAASEAPGLVATVWAESDDPVQTWTKAVAIALPVLGNPDLTLAADVQ